MVVVKYFVFVDFIGVGGCFGVDVELIRFCQFVVSGLSEACKHENGSTHVEMRTK